jgi:MFS family permease
VIAANVPLGVNQGLTWSMTVNMKIDLIGPDRRGVAQGINETAGYFGVAVTAVATGYLATWFGLRWSNDGLLAWVFMDEAIPARRPGCLRRADHAGFARHGPADRRCAPRIRRARREHHGRPGAGVAANCTCR